ncbi:MAG: hypothetical protein EOO56_00170 [Hymenobacter sp.]|nr:MAG: hypothetical protein EOO56_00170 [Hymenobacter sp.]
MTHLVLLAHSREVEYRRAVFAVLSFWAWHKGRATGAVQAVVFTDQPAFFEPYLAGLPVRYELLTAGSLAAMQQPQGYVHRVKPAILAQMAQAHPQDELLFIDSDTFFTSLPEALLQQLMGGTTFLHKREYRLTEAVDVYAAFGQAHFPKKLLEVLSSQRFEVAGAAVQFKPEQYSWNSGVLGLPALSAARLPDVLRVLDELYAGTGWFTCEQVAFSLVLQTQAVLRPCDEYVFHYWGQRQKQLMDGRLHPLIGQALADLPLAERLAQVRQLVPRWQRVMELDRLREGALYAFNQGQLVAGLKYAVRAWFLAPLSGRLFKDIWRLLRKKTPAPQEQLA